ncbi:nuclear transport factor 2 family protein [Pseudonocardia sp. KRD291]|uniref:nuclear transport factor 2 family protein n=1 Tax=Pseudonocardia sp. KRD291 TaxID=2792007 RepID=UPI001C49F647|nr:nuclear transport factor 2 family protein [Pseudonocardia sp. KRD291]MBW0105365.1 nuclear transport factor 2 family protein [Pseudonocardia sp. KRD291]
MRTLVNNVAHDLGTQFYAALTVEDWPAIRSLLHDDVTWTLPGDHAISGTAVGADAVIARLQKVAGSGVHFELQRILRSRDNVVLCQHNTARRGDRILS